MSPRWAPVILFLAAVTAGCTGVTGGSRTQVTPPPGADSDRVTNLTQLLAAHEREIAAHSYRINWTVPDWADQSVSIDRRDGEALVRTSTGTIYATRGGPAYSRGETANGTTRYRRHPARGEERFPAVIQEWRRRTVHTVLRKAFSWFSYGGPIAQRTFVPAMSFADGRTVVHDGTTHWRYRVTRVQNRTVDAADDITARTLLVSTDGIIRSFVFTTGRASISYRTALEHDVKRPEWYDTAVSRTAP